MTDQHEPPDDDQEFFAALGQIVFWATYLELDAAMLLAGIRETDPDLPVEALARQRLVDGLIEEVDTARGRARGPRVGSLLDEIRSWAVTAKRLLDERNRHVHAFWYWDLTVQPTTIRGEHARSGDLIDATPAKMDDLVDRLQGHHGWEVARLTRELRRLHRYLSPRA